jgi:thiamine biosynthesis lipoprotein
MNVAALPTARVVTRRFEARAMASALRLTIAEPTPAGPRRIRMLEGVWSAVRAEFEAAEAEMSRFRAASDLTRLNATAGRGQAVQVPWRLEHALVAADRAHRITADRFDPRVLLDLERLGYPGAPLDAMDTQRSGAGRIVRLVGRGEVTIDEPIDLGGIGKGLALRWSAAIVERNGIGGFLLEAGGDLVARGPGPDGGSWLVGIEDPGGGPDELAAIAFEQGAVATSSVRLRSWVQEGRDVHHLLDPRTGEPADGGLRAVTVLGPDPAWAEVWSKALFIGGHAEIVETARARGLAAWWVTDEGTLEMTPAARERTAWVAGED